MDSLHNQNLTHSIIYSSLSLQRLLLELQPQDQSLQDKLQLVDLHQSLNQQILGQQLQHLHHSQYPLSVLRLQHLQLGQPQPQLQVPSHQSLVKQI